MHLYCLSNQPRSTGINLQFPSDHLSASRISLLSTKATIMNTEATKSIRRTHPSPSFPTSNPRDRILSTSPSPAYSTDNTPSNTSPAVPTAVILKLLFFTFLMVVGPISLYFLTARTIFAGNTTYAGATAAVAANVVLIGYIVVAVREDQGDAMEAQAVKEREKKRE